MAITEDALGSCEGCGGTISKSALLCPHCGSRNKLIKSAKYVLLVAVCSLAAILPLLLFACWALFGYGPIHWIWWLLVVYDHVERG